MPFLTDANTIYAGERSDAVRHLALAHNHGFTFKNCGADVIIADGLRGNSYMEVEIVKKHFKKVKIARSIHYADALILATHFKGHLLTGFGGTLKNTGMGCGARPGKYEMHDSVVPEFDPKDCTGCGNCVKWCGSGALSLAEGNGKKKISFDKDKCSGCSECFIACNQGVFKMPWDNSSDIVQEKMVEYAYGVLKEKKYKVLCINFINSVTKECDCFSKKTAPLVPDVGVLISEDPVAIDKASVDLVNEVGKKDVFKNVYPHVNWDIQLKYAEKLGLGTTKYELIK